MFIRLLIITVCFCIVSCSGDADKLQIGQESFGRYKFDECIVKVVIDQERKLQYKEYRKLHHEVVPNALIKAIRSTTYPIFQIDMTRGGNLTREYYFFFAALCEKKVEYVNSIVKNYLLSQKEYKAIKYNAFEIVGSEIPEGVGGYSGLWVDK